MFLNSQSIKDNAANREIVFWGCSEDWIPKSSKLLPSVKKIIDLQQELIGEEWQGFDVIAPSKDISPINKYIVITSGSLESIVEDLHKLGFKPGSDYAFSPVFEDFKIIEEFNNNSYELIFTSSDYPVLKSKNRSSRLGGGLYKVKIDGDDFSFVKILEGSFRQITKFKSNYFLIDYYSNKVKILDNTLKLVDSFDLTRRHCTGIAVNKDFIIILSSADDAIIFYDKNTFHIVKEIAFGNKSFKGNGDYHINDCWLDTKNLYLTYFSKTGFWRNEIFDGGISVLDIESDIIEEIQSNLFQPHSPIVHDGELYFCESTNGRLFRGSNTCIFENNSFLRGITFKGAMTIFGQSETLYLKRMKNKQYLQMNSGIHILNENSKIVRFFPTLGIKNIHQIISL